MLHATAGVLLFVMYLWRGGTMNRHAVGFNAGASLFYANPWVLAVDGEQPALFFARLEETYGLFLPKAVACRLLALDPRHPGFATLPYAAAEALTAQRALALRGIFMDGYCTGQPRHTPMEPVLVAPVAAAAGTPASPPALAHAHPRPSTWGLTVRRARVRLRPRHTHAQLP